VNFGVWIKERTEEPETLDVIHVQMREENVHGTGGGPRRGMDHTRSSIQQQGALIVGLDFN
jgi:hypothetical protein